MVVLRCPYCGEEVKEGDNFCSHCGKDFDKPAIDEYATYHRDLGGWIATFFAFVILWFILIVVVGFVTFSVLHISDNHLLSFVLSFVLTVIIIVWWRLK